MISLRTSTEIRGRPGPLFLLFHGQKSRSPLRCQVKTVDGFSIARLSLQPSQKRKSRAQKTRSTGRIEPRSSMYHVRELVAQHHILGDEIGAVLEYGSNKKEHQWELARHSANHSPSPNAQEKPADPPSYRIMTRHKLQVATWRPECTGTQLS